jgi:ABC-type amino acid transport substrate-binding protein
MSEENEKRLAQWVEKYGSDKGIVGRQISYDGWLGKARGKVICVQRGTIGASLWCSWDKGGVDFAHIHLTTID